MKRAASKFEMEKFLRALSDRTRLRLLNLMGEDEVCVCFFVEVLQASQPKISRHLASLRRAGIVTARREGKWIHYRTAVPADPLAARILQELRAWMALDREMQTDRSRLVRFCCAPEPPVPLLGAPRPASLARTFPSGRH